MLISLREWNDETVSWYVMYTLTSKCQHLLDAHTYWNIWICTSHLKQIAWMGMGWLLKELILSDLSLKVKLKYEVFNNIEYAFTCTSRSRHLESNQMNIILWNIWYLLQDKLYLFKCLHVYLYSSRNKNSITSTYLVDGYNYDGLLFLFIFIWCLNKM
jgi:hypothetical protein